MRAHGVLAALVGLAGVRIHAARNGGKRIGAHGAGFAGLEANQRPEIHTWDCGTSTVASGAPWTRTVARRPARIAEALITRFWESACWIDSGSGLQGEGLV